jgi:hypothetical protein
MVKKVPSCWAIVLCGLSLTACGNSATGGPSSSTTTAGPPASAHSASAAADGYVKGDGDKDSDDEAHRGKGIDDDDDHTLLRAYPHQAPAAEKQAITAVVKHYYTAAAANAGAKACALLDTSLASGLGSDSSGPSQGGSTTCAGAVDRQFRELHSQFVTDQVATMIVTGVRTQGDFALALLGFKTKPKRVILLQHEGHAWKIAALFDSELP